MLMLYICLCLSFFLVFFLLFRNYRNVKIEKNLAIAVKRLIVLECEYYNASTNSVFDEYPLMQKNIFQALILNEIISQNFADWFSNIQLKIIGKRKAVKNSEYNQLLLEIHSCSNEVVRKLLSDKQEIFTLLYSQKHPVSAILIKSKFVILGYIFYMMLKIFSVLGGTISLIQKIKQYDYLFNKENAYITENVQYRN